MELTEEDRVVLEFDEVDVVLLILLVVVLCRAAERGESLADVLTRAQHSAASCLYLFFLICRSLCCR